MSEMTFTPPQAVRAAARRGLELREKYGRGGTAVGVARARDLSNGRGIPMDTISRMVSYFARHEVDKHGKGWGEDSAGYIAWLLWGGDAGRSWANGIKRDHDKDVHEMDDIDEMDEVSEVDYSANAPDENFAYVPDGQPPSARKIKIGDKQHAALAVPAVVNWEFEGNTLDIPKEEKGKLKERVSSAIRRYFSGAERDYYLTWLRTGKKPDKKPAAEMISFNLPLFTFADESSFPEVPIAPVVEFDALTKGDPEPLFVTRPLGKLNMRSDNGLVYDDVLLNDIQNQVVGKVARQGHVKEEDRASAFPDDVGIWVGTLRDGDTLYGKCYIYPGTHFQMMVRGRKAAGGTLANSIWGESHLYEGDDGTVHSAELELESIDFVPAERAALGALGGKFDLTSEMYKGEGQMADHDDAAQDLALLKNAIASIDPAKVMEMLSPAQRSAVAGAHLHECTSQQVYEMMSPDQRTGCAQSHIARMEPHEVYGILPAGHRKSVAEAHCAETNMKMIEKDADAPETKSLSEMKTRISEMEGTLRRYQREEFDRALDTAVGQFFDSWDVHTPKGKEQVSALKKNLRVLTVAEMAGSSKTDDIVPAANRAWDSFKAVAEMTRAALSGPSAMTGTTDTSGASAYRTQFGFDPATGRYTEDAVRQAVTRTNIFGGREGKRG